MGLKNFWKTAELADSDMLFQNRPTLAFGWTPTYMFFYFWKKKSCFFMGLHTKRGLRLSNCPKNDQKWTKMGYFGNFQKIDQELPTTAPKSFLGCYFGTLGYVRHKKTFVARFPQATTWYHFWSQKSAILGYFWVNSSAPKRGIFGWKRHFTPKKARFFFQK